MVDSYFRLPSTIADKLAKGDTDALSDEALFLSRYLEGKEKREIFDTTEEELNSALEWFRTVVIKMALIENVLDGYVYASLEDDEMKFQVSSEGMDYYNRKLK
jgi:hypothetical protein